MKLAGAFVKELRLLWRDRWGMGLMLLMPTLLVLILTLAQEDAFKTVKATSVAVLWVDEDGRTFSRDLEDGLARSGYFRLTRTLGARPLTREEALSSVARGDYRVCLVVPRGTSARLRKGVNRVVEEASSSASGEAGEAGEAGEVAAGAGDSPVDVYFDPTVPESYRSAVANGVGRAVQAVEMKWLFASLADSLGGSYGSPTTAGEPRSRWEPGQLVKVREGFARARKEADTVPSPAQQNVPGWSVFAMFLIAVPLSCNLIRERDTGTLLRLRMLPVSYTTILSAKVLAYLVSCLLQFGVLVLLGLYALPHLGTPRLDLGLHPLAAGAAAVASGLAAMGFGILVGSVARTVDQATVFVTTFAVIAGALGGVMIPSFLMPRPMQLVSPFSPLHWGLDAFLSVFLRGAGLREILPDLGRLLAFAAGCVLLAALWVARRDDSPVGLPFRLGRRSA
ncbi:MAG: ABC-2 transporter permease [Deltaproteobacteria bacterium]|nr:ABC-2 transporter permease [Deltaproteobacteria bacterium]